MTNEPTQKQHDSTLLRDLKQPPTNHQKQKIHRYTQNVRYAATPLRNQLRRQQICTQQGKAICLSNRGRNPVRRPSDFGPS